MKKHFRRDELQLALQRKAKNILGYVPDIAVYGVPGLLEVVIDGNRITVKGPFDLERKTEEIINSVK